MTQAHNPEAHAHKPVIALPFGPVTAPGQLILAGDGFLIGWGVIESTGAAAAEVDFFDGQSAGGVLIAPVSLTAGQSVRDNFGGRAHLFRNGIFASVTAGSVRGSVWIVAL